MRVVAMTVFCMVIVIFYSWFLVALCKDGKRQWRAFLVRVEPRADESQMADLSREDKTLVRAA